MSPSSTALPPIILYHYPYSPYARRVIWYLRLRGIPYKQCIQPPTLPRPDLTRLGLSYRRIPVLAIAHDVYLDSRLIFRKLESLRHPSIKPPLGVRARAKLAASSLATSSNPNSNTDDLNTAEKTSTKPSLTSQDATALALERLLSVFTTQTPLFFHAASLLPPSLPLMKDESFRRDRDDFFHGGKINTSVTSTTTAVTNPGPDASQLRAEAAHVLHSATSLLEETILADGRPWVLGEEGPTLADIEAVWVFHWVTGLPGMVDQELWKEKYPRVMAWIARFQAAVGAVKQNPPTLTGEQAADLIMGKSKSEMESSSTGSWEDDRLGIDTQDEVVKVCGLRKGSRVEVWPTDSGMTHRDRGTLIGIEGDEVVWLTGKGVRVHAPREGFRVRPEGGEARL